MAIKFLNTVAVDTNVLYVDAINNRVGIGTNNPDARLSVSDAGQAVFEILPFTNDYGTTLRSYDTVDEAFNYLSYKASIHTFYIGDAAKVRINSSGDVGIGTTSPFSKLEVVDTNRAPSLTFDANAAFSISTNASDQLAFGQDTAGPYPYWMQVRTSANAALPLSLNPLGGNVGIGTTSPGVKLDVSDVIRGRNSIRVDAASTGSPYLGLYQNGGEKAYLQYQDSGDKLVLQSDGYFALKTGGESDRITVLGNGDVGIGTTSPVAKLDVAGDLRIDGYSTTTNEAGLYLYNNISYSMASLANCNSNYNAFRIRGRNTATNTLAIGSNGNSDYVLQVVNDAGTVSGNISINPYGGNVGIGTASPGAKLDVYGGLKLGTTGTFSISQSPYASTSFYVNAGNGSTVIFGAPASYQQNVGVGGELYAYSGTTSGYLGTKQYGSFNNRLNPSGDNYLNSGNLGIGTTSPLEKLEVQGTMYATPISYAASQSAYALKMGASNNTAFDMGIKAKSTSSGSPYMSLCSDNADDVIVVRNSHVGINTASPSHNLHVTGNGKFSSTVQASGYKSSDGSAGITGTMTFVDHGSVTRTITYKNGLVVATS